MPSGGLRAVVDANVLVSGFLWGGTPNRLVETIRTGRGVLIASRMLLEEFGRTLRKPDLTARLDRAGTTPAAVMQRFLASVVVVDAPPLPAPVCHDPDDDAILALAVAARAETIVNGDKDLLVLGSYADIPILSLAEAPVRIAGKTP